MCLMQLSSLETDVLGVIAKIELSFARMARFDTDEHRTACQTLDELGLITTTRVEGMTIACMRSDGRSELEQRGFYRDR